MSVMIILKQCKVTCYNFTQLKTHPFALTYFAINCSLIDNKINLPNQLIYPSKKRLNTMRFSQDDIAKMMRKVIIKISENLKFRMLKICGKTTCKPLERIFRECLNTGLFPLEWKKDNLVAVYRKGDKQCKNYGPVSLLPVCVNMFDRLIFNEMFKRF